MKKECSLKEGRVITCHKCGQSGGTLVKDGVGYAHIYCPPVRRPVLTVPTPQELYAMRRPIQNREV